MPVVVLPSISRGDWVMALSAVTIIGFSSSSGDGGRLGPDQIEHLVRELRDAPPQNPVIVAIYHPPYSFDIHRGGHPQIAAALLQAFSASGRVPDMVISAHVHNYQRISHHVAGRLIPYLVIGNGGNPYLQQLAAGVMPGMRVEEGLVFDYGDASQFGFLTLGVSKGRLAGRYHGVQPGTKPDGSDCVVTADLDTFVL